MTDLCFSAMVGEVGLRTYEGVSQRIYSPPPLPLGTLPRRRTSHPCGRAFPSAGRGYGERLARCQPRENGSGRSPMTAVATPVFALEAACPAQGCRAEYPPGLILRRRHGSVAATAGKSMRQRGPRTPETYQPRKPGQPGKTGWNRKPERRRSPRGAEARAGDGAVILYGWHTVKAALENPARRIRRLFATENAARRLAEDGLAPGSRPNSCARTRSRTGSDPMPCTTDCWPKPIPCPRPSSTSSSPPASCSCSTRSPTRTMSAPSCARRRASRWRRWSPPRGTVRRRPACWRNPPPARSNMCPSSRCRISPARSRQLRERGYLLVGLDSTGDIDLGDAPLRAPLALVLGAEGKGLRQLTRATCDRVARLDLPGRIKSLNVSNAAALALYVATKRTT